MKVLLALLACVAVSHAAFTGSLQQRAQPLVNQAMFKLQLAGGRSGISDQILGFLRPYINGILSEITETVNTMHGTVTGHISNTLQDLLDRVNSLETQLGLSHGTLVGLLPDNVQDVVNHITGGSQNGQKVDLSGVMATAQSQLNGLVAAAQAQLEEIKPVINALINHANQLAQLLTMPNLMNWLAQQFGLQGRGLFSGLWGQITGAAGSVWDGITDAAGSAWDSATAQFNAWQTMASNAAGATMEQVSILAANFIQEAQGHASDVTADAAAAIQALMNSAQGQASAGWDNLQEQIDNIVNGNNVPAGKKF